MRGYPVEVHITIEHAKVKKVGDQAVFQDGKLVVAWVNRPCTRGFGYESDAPNTALRSDSTKAARLIIKKWEKSHKRLPDAIVVEAPGMAGGHLGVRKEEVYSTDCTLEYVVPELVEFLDKEAMVDIHVVAAGGIWSRADMLHAFELGARGVQMGSRFVCTHECDAPDAFKRMYLNAGEGDITLMESPVGLPGRAIKNPFLDSLASGPPPGHKCIVNCLKHCSFKVEKEGFCIAKALTDAQKGDVDGGLIFSGSNAALCREIVSVSDIFDDLFMRAGKVTGVSAAAISAASVS